MKEYAVYKNDRFEGATFATSEAQAINNVRHRNYGDFESQYWHDWTAVDVTEEEERKAKKKYNDQMVQAVEKARQTWKKIPENSSVESLHPPCEFYPMIKNIEPDLISRGSVNGERCDLGFFRGHQEPEVYRIVAFEDGDPQEQLDIFNF